MASSISNELKKCAVCGKSKRTVTLQLSRRQLYFGGFHVTYEYRCQACESKLAKKIQKLLDNVL